MQDKKINTRLGIYEENCGLENVVMSWGHDEYMYKVLKGNECYLPEEALYMIRYCMSFAIPNFKDPTKKKALENTVGKG